ncbi:Acyl carrier protein [Sulfidibacter corallicola]|uniref:Acyl carrier protein n=1 Tax=Sulfidibacter corallicola TaxID=2818388 RepID=A0A8A4TLX2_SULCO|nr:acyl carrier protein [Sulfidibacter corallicola]QTD49878.1 acyl carrier protein [Sulfidibacter corallicola]
MSDLTFESFKKIVAEQLGVDGARLSEQSHLTDDLGADSIAMVNIVAEVEALLDTEFDDLPFEDIETLGQAYQLVKAQ